MPAFRAWWLSATQSMPPETAEVPPSSSLFSRTTTDLPARAAVAAAVRAPAPEPTTTTS